MYCTDEASEKRTVVLIKMFREQPGMSVNYFSNTFADLGMSSKPNDRLDVCNLPSRGNFSPGHRKTRSLGKEGNFSSAMKPKSENSQNKRFALNNSSRESFPAVSRS